jgi:hypothetical protein
MLVVVVSECICIVTIHKSTYKKCLEDPLCNLIYCTFSLMHIVGSKCIQTL